jgi:hypothetical protein
MDSYSAWTGGLLRDRMVRAMERLVQVNTCQDCGSLVFKGTAGGHGETEKVSFRSWWNFFRHYAEKVLAKTC